MRPSLALLLFLTLQLLAAEAPATYPLWDGHESVESYAAHIKWPATKSIDLGKGVTMDFVLIPAGRFIMGTPAPKEPTVTAESAENMFVLGLILFLSFISVLVVRKLQGKIVAFSLRYLMVMTVFGGLIFGSFGRMKLAEEQAAKYEEEYTYSRRKVPDNEKPGKEATIEQPFYMGKYTVTEQQYAVLMPMPEWTSQDATGKSSLTHYQSIGENAPVKCSWDNALEFLDKFTPIISESGLKAKLPSSEQWEYACRAGTTTKFHSGNNESDLDAVGWYANNSGGKLHAVGLKKPNAFGLYDMHGNIWQWCDSIFNMNDYGYAADSAARVTRGGVYDTPSEICRSALIDYTIKTQGQERFKKRMPKGDVFVFGPCGFRVILKPSPKP
ncbi:MAG: formylglycine-generating enzyme family protein [Planctomycetota bacterium]